MARGEVGGLTREAKMKPHSNAYTAVFIIGYIVLYNGSYTTADMP